MLGDRLRAPGPELSSPEDLLSSSLGVIFPDDITNQHGDAAQSITYLSPRFGALPFTFADPQGEDSRRLFSHHLWNSGLQLTQFIEDGRDEGGREWSVAGARVLELGAGAGLTGTMAALVGAAEVVLSDYAAVEVLANLKANVSRHVDERRKDESVKMGRVLVQGHEWGVLDDAFAHEYKGAFDTILVADCLWMPWQHANLLRSIAWFLAAQGRAWVIAGFHTGRAKLRGFFEAQNLGRVGLEVETLYERNAEGVEREWVVDRGIEDVTERKRWLVIGILKKKAT